MRKVVLAAGPALILAIRGRRSERGRSSSRATRRTRIQGTGIQNGSFRAHGKFRRGGKLANGSVKFSLERTDGVGCGTGNARWKARR